MKRFVLPFWSSVLTLVTFNLEQGLDGLLDRLLVRVHGHFENDLVLFGDQRRFLGDDRATDDVVMMLLRISP